MVGLPFGEGEGVFGLVGGRRRVCFDLFLCCDRDVSEDFEGQKGKDLQVCVVSLRILYGDRSRGSGGGEYCDGVVARDVERQRMQVFCWRDCSNSRFKQLDCRSVGAVEAMGVNVHAMWTERCPCRRRRRALEKRAKKKLPGRRFNSRNLSFSIDSISKPMP